MKNQILWAFLFLFPIQLLLTSCQGIKHTEPGFEQVFVWGNPHNEETARKFAEIGATDILVNNKKQYDLALKYGMTPYWGRAFTPAGPHKQVMNKEEEKYHSYINGYDLDRKKYSRKEISRIVKKRMMEKNHRFGGEAGNGVMDTLNTVSIACFNSDKGYRLSRKKIDRILKRALPGVKGIVMDYLGYTNHHGCYCKVCLQEYKNHLRKNGLKDTKENKNIFYRDCLVNYYNAMIDHVKSKYPHFKVAVHIYPVFQPDPLYGNRIKADLCGQTVAWYFLWPLEKIARYTKITVQEADKYFPHAAGIPFVGLNGAKGSALYSKTPQELEKELQTILAAGGRSLMVCNGGDMIKPSYYEVFRKYSKNAKTFPETK